MRSKEFHERFQISVGRDEAERRFMNRFYNLFAAYQHDVKLKLSRRVADSLGERYTPGYDIQYYVKDDFSRCLIAVESIFTVLESEAYEYDDRGDLSLFESSISNILEQSEVDLGIRWKKGIFILSGAALLDNKLVNDPLQWMSDQRYTPVETPFRKGLSIFSKSLKHTELRQDAITDMYESLEALAGIIVGRQQKDLSANAESFLKKIQASDSYKSILKEYIKYANEFRHAVKTGKAKPVLSMREVESFIYLTGLFIRLTMGKE
jgi:hypothetical protein